MTSGELRVSVGLIGTVQSSPAGAIIASGGTVNDGTLSTRAYGTGSGYVDLAAGVVKVLAPGASATLDLYTGTDVPEISSGGAAPFRLIKTLLVWVDSGGDTSGVKVGAAASNVFPANFADTSDAAVVYPSGAAYVMDSPAGVAVTSSAKNFKIENIGAAQATVAVYALGSAAVSGVPMGMLLTLTYP